MFNALRNFYAERRQARVARGVLKDSNAGAPPENLLQAIWFHQRLLQDKLQTTEKVAVRVLHPGFWNHGPGPDFQGAVIQFGKDKPISGDVEIDLQTSDWKAHGHDENPEFKKVILHVTWENAGEKIPHPTLLLKPVIDATLRDLDLWLGNDNPKLPEVMLGKCHAPLKNLAARELEELLRQAGLVRLQEKAFHLAARAKQKGWEQTLWEGLLRGLGYKQNTWPMQRLAELTQESGKDCGTLLHCQARFFGLSGLLPHDFAGKNHEYGRTLWDFWWRERARFDDAILPRQMWRFSSTRPTNHPQRRIALASQWFWNGQVTRALSQWFENPGKYPDSSLLELLEGKPDEFWSWHYTLTSKKAKRLEPLIGKQRVTDLAVNVVLPWFWAKGEKAKAEELYQTWPAAEDNSVLRKLRMRLFANATPPVLRKAAIQQGLIQVSRDYCERCNSLCEGCEFPGVVIDFQKAAAAGSK